MRFYNLLFIIFFQCFGSYYSYSQIEVSNLDNHTLYTTENGLLSNYIANIIEDKNGFLWIANGKGVTKFDGNYFKNYNHYYENETAFKIGFVNNIIIDDLGEKLFIANNKGIFYTSINKINFKKIHAVSSSANLSIKKINEILFSTQSTLWAASNKDGLLKIDIDKNEYKNFRFINTSLNDSKELNTIICISKDPTNSNVLWLGTLAGLIRFNTISNEYKVFVYNDNSSMAQNRIRDIYVSNNDVYLGTWSEGLVIFNKHNQQFKQPLKIKYPKSNTLILNFYKDNKQNLWITSTDGLLKFDIASNTLINSIQNQPVKGIIKGITYVDSRGVIWYGYSKGLFKYNSQNKFIQLEERTNLQNPLLIKKIIRLNGFIYVLGYKGSGLYKVNPNNYSFETIKITTKNNQEIDNSILRDMVKMDEKSLLILSNDKILVFNTVTQKTKLSLLQIDFPSPSLQTIVKGKNNRYWVGGRRAGLTSLNFTNNTTINYKNEFHKYEEGNHIWINVLHIDNNNKLWIAKGTSSVMDLDNLTLSLLNPKDSIPYYNDAAGFLEDNKGRVWVAGFNDGLGYINFKDFKKGITHKLEGRFEGIYKYNDTIMWTTGDGLLGKFNTNTNSLEVISINNRNQYISGPIFNNKKGEYFIGCNNGIIIYKPDSQEINNEPPKPYIRKITGNGNIYYEESSLTNKNLSFKSGINHLVINVSALGFQEPERIMYSYKLNKDWISLNTSQEINITNLDQGNYDFKIKACNDFGNCSETTYNFTILSPWYRSWLAYILYTIFIFTIGALLYRFNLDKQLALADKKKAIEIDEIKSEMYANISHEFRTPLTVIIGMTDILSNLKKKFKGADKPLEMIRRNSNNLLQLINEMLDLAKSESANMKLNLLQTDVIPFIKYLSESFNSIAEEDKINLTIYAEVEKLIMDFDAKKLTSIIYNLLSNAIKFTPQFGKIIVHINKVTQKNNSYLFIKIKDNGIGISKNDLPNIFNRFYQTEASLTRKNKGTGIGLALTKELVELMKGTIEVKSKLNGGTEFTVLIPVTRNASTAKNTRIDNTEHTTMLSASTEDIEEVDTTNSELPLVLIIEDNKDVAHYLKTCLKNKYETIHAINGIEGIEMAFKKIPDIIITDVMMPGKDGFEVCATLKSDERTDHIPIIILTAKVTTEDRLTGLSHGADAYLAKPFNKEELFIRLDQLLLLRKKLIDKIQKTGFIQFLNKRSKDPKIQFLQKAITLIEDEIKNSTFGSEELSTKLQLSNSQVYRKIKAITGKSTAVFIRSIRLQYAKELLKNTDKTISEIAYEVGFNNPSWFSRAFKEEFGYTPSSSSK
jgi:signal transduction histidine kinase/DNA-binding response OmpR family regulator/ligand-binding sensor domain-containing protein